MSLAFWNEHRDEWLRRYRALTAREQGMLVIGAAAVALAIIYGVVIAPVNAALAHLKRAEAQDTIALARMRAEAEAVVMLRARAGAPEAGDLMAFLEQSATADGVRGAIAQMEPAGAGRARVVCNQVRFAQILAWLADVGGRGIRVERATIDRAGPPGMANVTLVLAVPAS